MPRGDPNSVNWPNYTLAAKMKPLSRENCEERKKAILNLSRDAPPPTPRTKKNVSFNYAPNYHRKRGAVIPRNLKKTDLRK